MRCRSCSLGVAYALLMVQARNDDDDDDDDDDDECLDAMSHEQTDLGFRVLGLVLDFMF